jgi:type I restriction enzyme R subunit
MCAQLSGATSWFLPFNKGVNGGKGNPVNPHGLMTAYLWEEVLTKQRLSNILEDFAQIMVSEDEDTHKKKETVIWPRYHQLDAVRKLLNDVKEKGIGQRYLIQHSAGSGKSNSITWLAYQLVGLLDGTQPLVDSVVIVTDRVNLDKQIYNNIMAFQKLKGLVVRANTSEALAEALKGGKKIVTTTVQKFPYILDTIGTILKDRHFALIIDEAHSSQNGAMAAQANMVVSGTDTEDVEDLEDKILKIIEGRKMAKNASYFAFTATPKNKTLQKFGTPLPPDADGNVQHVPFHVYSMKQAIEEGFIMDVLRNYTPYQSFYKIVKSVSSDPEYDKKQATAKLRAWVESQPETIAEKTRIIVEHFHECVINKGKVGGQARAMLVTSGIHRAIEFYYAITKALEARKSPYKAIVAFSGEQEYGGKHVTEASINGFPSAEIEKKIRRDPYRILVVADKFQTGYDEKLLHTMYVDKVLAGVNAVQTLSRLNRCHPKKSDTFVLDFADNAAAVYKAFQEYYKCTILKQETDPNKLNDLLQKIEDYNIYTTEDVNEISRLLQESDDRSTLDPILDAVVARFKELDDDSKIDCKSAIKAYNRTYSFLSAILPYGSVDWEKSYEFLLLLVKKLPKIAIEDGTDGLIESVDFEHYKSVKQDEIDFKLTDEDSVINPIPVSGGGSMPTPDLDKLSSILQDFNAMYGNINWEHPEKVVEQIKSLPEKLAKTESFAKAVRRNDNQNAEIEAGEILVGLVAEILNEETEFARYYLDHGDFKALVNQRVFKQAYDLVRK